ncbi:MAG: [FeFe] hydrogenase H-cluster radical SAM maturase HydE [Peptostreptococcaceae bacterium]|nr:[FeFe] hydrogenase H-cluster radical SAM maturase HydE [Peptostreptococcaceae bacterium]
MKEQLKDGLSRIKQGEEPDKETLKMLVAGNDEEINGTLISMADETRRKYYGNKVYMRGLIEFSNFCKRNCKYCGIRGKNSKAERYRLNKDEIIGCCANGYDMGYRTFVLQGGEDSYYSDEIMVDIISSIKGAFQDVVVTLSIGEKSEKTYRSYYEAGADRYLIRHETASPSLYDAVHENMHLKSRLECLYSLKRIGYQIGAGFMVGLPGQTDDDLAHDLLLLMKMQPHMVGIGPFIPHADTPFRDFPKGDVDKTVRMIALSRLMVPKALIPATTALGTADAFGRERGLMAGANVVMPNLSPMEDRSKYMLYDNKLCMGEESAECTATIRDKIESAGYELDMSRGDHIDWRKKQ